MTDVENPELFDLPNSPISPIPDVGVDEIPAAEEEPKPTKSKTKRTYKKRVAPLPATDDTALPTETAPIPEVAEKKKRKLSPEQYERLCEQLKRGRQTGLEKRKKNAQLKAIAKEKKNQADDDLIFESMAKKREPTKLQAENDALKLEMAELRKNDKNVKAVPNEVKAQKLEKVEKVVEKVEVVAPPVLKQLSNRDRLKLLKGL